MHKHSTLRKRKGKSLLIWPNVKLVEFGNADGRKGIQKEGTNEDMETRVRCGIKRTGRGTMGRQRKEPWLLRPPPPGSLPAPRAVPELQWDRTDIPSLQSASYRRAGFHAGCLQGSHAITQKVDGALPPVCAEVGKCAELQNQSDPCHVLERQSSPGIAGGRDWEIGQGTMETPQAGPQGTRAVAWEGGIYASRGGLNLLQRRDALDRIKPCPGPSGHYDNTTCMVCPGCCWERSHHGPGRMCKNVWRV